MSDTDRLLQTIETLHAASLDENLWPDALAATTRLLNGRAATLEIFALPGHVPKEFHQHGIPPASEIDYFAEYAALNPRSQYVDDHPADHIHWDYKLIDERGMDRHPFYVKFLPQCDLRYYIAGNLHRSRSDQAAICVHRTRKQGHADEVDIAMMQRLLPHFRQAFDMALRLRSIRARNRSLEDTLDWLADGVALLAADGKVLHANAALQQTLRSGDGISVKKGQIEFAASETRQRFAKAIKHSVRSGPLADPSAERDFPAPRRSNGPAYLVSVRPLARLGRNVRHDERAAAILFVRDPLQRGDRRAHILREVFGFTAAEADLAEALQAGIAIDDYGRSRRLSRNTVYTHLRHAREKTGARSTTELLRKLNDTNNSLRGG